MGGLLGIWGQVSIIANLAIVAGYLLVPFTVLRYLPLRRGTLIAGAVFFATCALTHLSMATAMSFARWMVVNHVVQAVAVVWFVTAFARELRQATHRRTENVTGEDKDET